MTNWTKSDFIINKGSLISLSKKGGEKLRNTDTLVIPEGIVKVANGALGGNSFKKLVLPSSLKVVGDDTFINCGIREIHGGENVTEIHAQAFSHNNLKSVTGFLNLVRIKNRAFSENKIEDFFFGKNLKEIDIFAFAENRFKKLDFSNCTDFEIKEDAFTKNLISEVNYGKKMNISKRAFRFNRLQSNEFVDSDITEPISYSEEAKPDYSWQKKHFIFRDNAFVDLTEEGYEKLKNADNITFPSIENITRISINFLKLSCNYKACFKEVYISEGVEEICDQAFSLKRIEKVHLPESLKIIGKEAFQGILVRSIKLPENLTTLRDGAFCDSEFQSVDLSETKITEIPYACFGSCLYLKEVKFPKSLETINSYAFAQTYSLQGIIIPENTTWIGHYAFSSSGLEKVEINKSKRLYLIGDSAFENSRLKYFPFEKMEHIEIIGFRAFEGNDLDEVVIKEGNELRGDAFKNNNIKKVDIEKMEKLSEDVFAGNNIEYLNISDDSNFVDDEIFWEQD